MNQKYKPAWMFEHLSTGLWCVGVCVWHSKALGAVLNNQLTFSAHVADLVTSVSPLQLYKDPCRPLGCLTWDCTNTACSWQVFSCVLSHPLELIQNTAVWLVFNPQVLLVLSVAVFSPLASCSCPHKIYNTDACLQSQKQTLTSPKALINQHCTTFPSSHSSIFLILQDTRKTCPSVCFSSLPWHSDGAMEPALSVQTVAGCLQTNTKIPPLH